MEQSQAAACFMFRGDLASLLRRAGGSYLTDLLFNFIFISGPGLSSGQRRSCDALCRAAEGGAQALLTSAQRVNLIGPLRTLGVRRDHDEEEERKKKKKIRNNQADLKNSRHMSVYLGCVRLQRNTTAGFVWVHGRFGERGTNLRGLAAEAGWE